MVGDFQAAGNKMSHVSSLPAASSALGPELERGKWGGAQGPSVGGGGQTLKTTLYIELSGILCCVQAKGDSQLSIPALSLLLWSIRISASRSPDRVPVFPECQATG